MDIMETVPEPPLKTPKVKPKGNPNPVRISVDELNARRELKKELKARQEELNPFEPVPDDGAAQDLQDMRHVCLNDKRWDQTQGQKNQRAYLEKHAPQFHKAKAELEKEHAAIGKTGSSIEAQVEPDVGADKIEALLVKLLAEAQEEPKKRRK